MKVAGWRACPRCNVPVIRFERPDEPPFDTPAVVEVVQVHERATDLGRDEVGRRRVACPRGHESTW